MKNEDDLAELRSDWQRSAFDLETVRLTLARRRRDHGLAQIGNGLCLVLATALFGWFVHRVMTGSGWLFVVGAAVILISIPLLLVQIVELGREARTRYDDTTGSLLLNARRRIAFELRLVRIGRHTVALFVAGAMATIGLVLFGLAPFRSGGIVAFVWGATAGLTWKWLNGRRAALQAEAERCERLIDEFAPAESDGDGVR